MKIVSIISVSLLLLGCNRPAIEGSEAQVEASEKSVAFGEVEIGESVRARVTLSNKGQTQASSLEMSGIDAPFESLSAENVNANLDLCSSGLESGKDCEIVLEFTPSQEGAFEIVSELTYHSGLESTTIVLTITGTGVLPPIAEISASTDAIDFGSFLLGNSVTQTMTLTNTGEEAATSLLPPPLSAPFRYLGGAYPGTGGDCGTSLAVGSSCVVKIEFEPTVDGTFSDTWALQYDNGFNTALTSTSLTGEGRSPADAFLGFVEGSNLVFTSVKELQTTSSTLTLKNSGGVTATGIAMSGLAGEFDFLGGSFPGTGGDCDNDLNVDETCTVVVSFVPSGVGTFSDTLTVAYNDGTFAQVLNLPVQGTGIALDPAVLSIVSGTSYSFSDTVVDLEDSIVLTVVNNGEKQATTLQNHLITSPFEYTGGSYPGTAGTCGATLAAGGATCTIDLTFSPEIGGTYNETWSLHYNDGDSSQFVQTTLSGVGVPYGQLDTTFSGDGIASFDFSAEESVAGLSIESGGKAVFVGNQIDGANDQDFHIFRLTTAGAADTSYGSDSNGFVASDINGGSEDIVSDIDVQADDKVVVFGRTGDSLTVRRFLTDGDVDTSLVSPVGGFGLTVDAKVVGQVQTDGKILVAGTHSPLFGDQQSFVLKLTSAGALDILNFNGLGLGINMVDFDSSEDDRIEDLTIDTSDRIVVCGSADDGGGSKDTAIARLLSSGALDTTFDGDGRLVIDVSGSSMDDECKAVVTQNDDKIIVVGSSDNGSDKDLLIARFNTNGNIDTSFGVNGIVVIDVGGADDEALSVELDSSQRIVVSGYTNNGSNEDVVLVRLETDGSRDTKFGSNGVVTTSVGSGDERSTSLSIQADGKIVLGGYTDNGTDKDYLVLRYTP
jgi:uncharacterized delta-60 repeat protein